MTEKQARSNIEWQQWAKTDPLYGVATIHGREKSGANPWSSEEFYAYGELIFSEYLPAWKRYGLDLESCIEIGCGAGRITRQLARNFHRVSGIDVSSDMIALAKRAAPEAEFALSDGVSLPRPDNSFSAAFSCEVFQHFDSRDMAASYFREIFRVLSAGGTMMIHLPIAVLPFRRIAPTIGRLQETLWRASDRWQQIKSTAKRWLILHRNRRPFYRLLQYEPDWLLARLTEAGFVDVQIWVFPVTGIPGEKSMAPHLFARKPASPANRRSA